MACSLQMPHKGVNVGRVVRGRSVVVGHEDMHSVGYCEGRCESQGAFSGFVEGGSKGESGQQDSGIKARLDHWQLVANYRSALKQARSNSSRQSRSEVVRNAQVYNFSRARGGRRGAAALAVKYYRAHAIRYRGLLGALGYL